MNVEKILVPTDFSEAGQGAVVRGFAFAQRYGSPLHLLHVVRKPPETSMFPVTGSAIPSTPSERTEWTTVQEEVAKELAAMAAPLAPEGVEYTTGVEVAYSPAEVIVQWVEENDASLIVMGTHGHQGMRRFLLGSVAESVIRSASCPVLTIGANVSIEPARPNGILGALDLQDGSDGVIAAVEDLARTFEAEAHYLHVVPPVELGMYLDASTMATFDPKALVESARPQLRGRLESMGVKAGDCTEKVVTGHPESEIVGYAEAKDIDVIVVARHSREDLPRALVGSVADRVIRSAVCPVLTVPGREEAK